VQPIATAGVRARGDGVEQRAVQALEARPEHIERELALDGKLSLDDPVRKYLPDFPEYDRPITIRNLLTHTSGLREWSSLVAAAGWPRGTRASTQADLLDIVYRQKALNYPVGDYWSYTNSGYAVAMTLVERVSGKTFQEFTRERIFGPLGMTHTQWRDDFTRLVPGRAQAYTREGDGWHLAMPFEDVVGPGGLLTTVGDWLIWNEALASRTLGAAWADSLTRRARPRGPVRARALHHQLPRRERDLAQRLDRRLLDLPGPLPRPREPVHRRAV
jgi:CubicO group peptidase (beta-lactamase class C family)